MQLCYQKACNDYKMIIKYTAHRNIVINTLLCYCYEIIQVACETTWLKNSCFHRLPVFTRDSSFSCWGHKDNVLRCLNDGNTDARFSSITYLISSRRSNLQQIHVNCTLTTILVHVLRTINKLFSHSTICNYSSFPTFYAHHRLRSSHNLW